MFLCKLLVESRGGQYKQYRKYDGMNFGYTVLTGKALILLDQKQKSCGKICRRIRCHQPVAANHLENVRAHAALFGNEETKRRRRWSSGDSGCKGE